MGFTTAVSHLLVNRALLCVRVSYLSPFEAEKLFIFYVSFFLRQRDTEREQGRGREREARDLRAR